MRFVDLLFVVVDFGIFVDVAEDWNVAVLADDGVVAAELGSFLVTL